MYQHGESIKVRYIFYRILKCKYLRVITIQDNEVQAELSRRIHLANKCYFGADTLLNTRSINKPYKPKN